jgi:hypothetical protein
MNLALALRAVSLLAFVAISTALIVQPAVLGIESGPAMSPLATVVTFSRF